MPAATDENRIQAIDDKGKTSTYGYDDQGERVIKQASQNLTVYVNQYFTERNGTIGSKHIFVGNTRMVTKVTGGTNFIRSYDGVTDANTPPGQAKKSEPVPSEPTQSEPQPDTTAADTAGTNNGNAYGRDKDKPAKAGNKDKSKAKKAGAATMTAGLTGLMNRAERANEVAQNTCKNKHLREQYCDEDGNGLPDSQEGEEGDTGGGTGDPDEGTLPEDEVIQIGSNGEQLFYYHSDHLGSTGYVTRENGEVHEHIQYFPFGETWVQQGGNTEKSPYLFTSKELDEETGLYYFGARYYDPRTSVWQSADPIIADYLPQIGQSSEELPALGGIYNSPNLGLYTYTHNNPQKYTDPDGKIIWGAVIGAGIEIAAQLATDGKVSDWNAVGVSAAVGLVTGGVGGKLATNAAKGVITSSQAVRGTAATSAVTSGLGSAATDKLNGRDVDVKKAAVASGFGLLGGTFGGKSANAATAKLEQMSAKGGLSAHVADTTKSAIIGKAAEKTTSAGQAVGESVPQLGLSITQKKTENILE